MHAQISIEHPDQPLNLGCLALVILGLETVFEGEIGSLACHLEDVSRRSNHWTLQRNETRWDDLDGKLDARFSWAHTVGMTFVKTRLNLLLATRKRLYWSSVPFRSAIAHHTRFT